MILMKCPYCGNESFEKFNPPKGDKMFIGCANTKTHEIFIDNGFICDLYVCTVCGNVHLKLEK